jgi:hypothetical protein
MRASPNAAAMVEISVTLCGISFQVRFVHGLPVQFTIER